MVSVHVVLTHPRVLSQTRRPRVSFRAGAVPAVSWRAARGQDDAAYRGARQRGAAAACRARHCRGRRVASGRRGVADHRPGDVHAARRRQRRRAHRGARRATGPGAQAAGQARLPRQGVRPTAPHGRGVADAPRRRLPRVSQRDRARAAEPRRALRATGAAPARHRQLYRHLRHAAPGRRPLAGHQPPGQVAHYRRLRGDCRRRGARDADLAPVLRGRQPDRCRRPPPARHL